MRQRWVVISNCQSFGLADSIDCLARDVDCTAIDYWHFTQRAGENRDFLLDYDLALLLPGALDWAQKEAIKLPSYFVVPSFEFCAYHPDCVYVAADGEQLQGQMSAYHSMIALAAYKEGLSAERAAVFFNADIFARASYFVLWEQFRDGQIAVFRDYGLDVAPLFVRHSRGRSFMHTVNHPKIEILFDIARLVLEKLGRPIFSDVDPPPDRLAGIVWPVYPEIGERLGVRGSYLFKPPECHKPLELIPFLERSLATFSAWDRSLLRVIPNLEPLLQRVRRAMREAA